MSVITFEGFIENGQIRLLGDTRLPERARVYVVVPESPKPMPRIHSPRLADPSQLPEFTMEVTAVDEGTPDAEV